MANDEIPLPPSEVELLGAIKGEDILAAAVRGHQFLETLLRLAISEALPMPHVMEVERLAFPLKVDLAIALGMIPRECRPGYLKINSIRNRVAHDQDAQFARRDALEAYDALSTRMREALGRSSDLEASPLSILKRCIQMLFVVLQESISSARDRGVEHQVVADLAEETHRRVNPGVSDEELDKDPFSQRINARIRDRVEEERKRRQERGDL